MLAALFSREARADVSSWFLAGGGVTFLPHDHLATQRPGTLHLELGVGSPPHTPVIVGGVFKSLTFFGQGTDLLLVTRVASGGFVRGGFGLAVDAGGYQRWWGVTNSTGFTGALVFGAPFGLELTALTEQGSNQVHTYGATIGVDFLRLTVYRTALNNVWPNPFLPAHVDASR